MSTAKRMRNTERIMNYTRQTGRRTLTARQARRVRRAYRREWSAQEGQYK